MSTNVISVTELHELTSESGGGVTVVDVRESDEYALIHAPVGENIPLSVLTSGELGFLAKLPKDEPIYALCRSGRRSESACGILHRHGFRNVTNVTGGILAWEAAGLPVVRGRSAP